MLQGVSGGTTNYYFATAGSDSNNCLTTGTACQTITHLNSLTYSSGATIHLNGGDTFSGSIAITTTNAPSGNITITSYGAGTPTISSGNSAACVTVTDVASVSTGNLVCTGGGNATNTTDGIAYVNDQAGNTSLTCGTISNVTVSAYGLNGIHIAGTNGYSGWNGCSLTGSITVHDVSGNTSGTLGTGCIIVNSPNGDVNVGAGHYAHSNITITANVTAYNCTGTSGLNHWTGSGIYIGQTNGATIGASSSLIVVHDFGINNTNASGPVGVWTSASNNVTLQFFEAYNGKASGGGGDGDGCDQDGGTTNSIIQYAYVHDNAGMGCLQYQYVGAAAWNNNTIRFIISQNNNSTNGEIVTWADAALTNAEVYNNTVYAGVVGVAWGCAGAASKSGNIANNILFGVAGDNVVSCGTPSSLALNGNDYYGSAKFSWNGSSYTTFAGWKTGSSQETVNGGFNSNPQIYVPGGGFITNGYSAANMMAYNLQAGSPMLPNAGINLNSQFGLSVGTQDFFGNAVTAATLPVGAAAADAGTFAASCTAATNFLARVSSFSKANNINYNSLLCGLNSDGDLAHTDFLYILGAPNSAASLLNLISASYSLTLHGSTTFAANVGITGDGSTGYYDTGFVPSSAGGHMTINSTAVQVYDLSSRATTQTYSAIGAVDATTDTEVDPMRFTGSAFVSANDFTGFQPTQTTSAGLTLVNRTGATATAAYQNGSSIGTAGTTSIGLPTVSFFVLAKNSSGSAARFSADQLSAVMGGDGTISPSRTSLRLNSFMTSLGINVY